MTDIRQLFANANPRKRVKLDCDFTQPVEPSSKVPESSGSDSIDDDDDLPKDAIVDDNSDSMPVVRIFKF